MQVDPKSNDKCPQKRHIPVEDTRGSWCDARDSDLSDVATSQGEEEETWDGAEIGV